MNSAQTPSKEQRDHRTQLYERYVSLQVQADINQLRDQMSRRQPYLERMIATYFPASREARILDAGCGYGLLLAVLRRAGYSNVSGVETSREQVETARTLGIAGVEQGDLTEKLAQSEAAFDVIVAFDVLEHFTKDEVLAVMTAMFRALRPGGTLVLHVPNGEAIFAGKIFFGDFTHQVAFTARSMAQVAGHAGFADVRCFEDKPVVHGVFSLVRAALWWLVRTRYRLINLIETGDVGRSLILTQNLLAVCRKP